MSAKRPGGRVDWLGRGLLLIVLAGAIGLVFLSVRSRRSGADERAATPPVRVEEDATGSAAEEAGFHRLEGRWLRPDGGYVLELNWVSGDGRVDAVYLNPRPVRVSRAEVSRESGVIQVRVELQDVGYPGCVYRLTFDPTADMLRGTYYQAAMGETFEVEFTRLDARGG
jgi:hypothetical protein